MYIVELEKGVWNADWPGDPGRTLVEGNARKYKRLQDAKAALTRARKYRPFKNAEIVDLDEMLTCEEANTRVNNSGKQFCPHCHPDAFKCFGK